MIDESDPQRERIHEVLQEVGPLNTEERAAVLVGWAVVTEWMDETGERWLAKAHSASVANWTANGMHHEALYGDWGDSDE